MTRKRKSSKKKKIGAPVLHCLNPNAAGVDVGATEIYIAVPVDRDPQPVRHFSTFTEDLHAVAAWLKACKIETVAMESRRASTGSSHCFRFWRHEGSRCSWSMHVT